MEQRNVTDRRRPSVLVFFAENEKPRQYVLFHDTVISGGCRSEIFTPSSLQLTYSFLDHDQWEITREGECWMLRCLSDNGQTIAGDHRIGRFESVMLTDGMVIRLLAERTLNMVFLKTYIGGREWSFISEEMRSPECMTVPIREQMGLSRTSGFLYGYPNRLDSLSIRIDERSTVREHRKVALLKDIDLSVAPGRMVLILGGSGAGKSTFVNAVTGYEKAKARITEGGIDYYGEDVRIRHRIGFVPQENLLREEDTVHGVMYSAAQTRLPRNLTAAKREERITATLETFGLTGKERELVGRLSGGEKKRLSICTEYISSPAVFILDEPDSGLDGSMARELMENLLLTASQGHTVMVITHSPDRVAHLFDEVIVLARDSEQLTGQVVYHGGIEEAKDYFGVFSLEGIVRRLNARNEGGEGRADEYIMRYRHTVQSQKATRSGGADEDSDGVRASGKEDRSRSQRKDLQAPRQEDRSRSQRKDLHDPGQGDRADSRKRAAQGNENFPDAWEEVRYKNALQQIPVYLHRQLRLMRTEKNWKFILMAVLISWLVIYVLGQSMFRNMEYTKYGAMALICVCIWNGMFNSVQVVCKERRIVKREHRAGMHIVSYIAAHAIYQAMICFIQVVLEVGVFWLGRMYFPETGLVSGSFALDLGISMFLITFAADMLGLMISCVVHSTTTAMTLMPFLLLVQLVFSGSAFPISKEDAKVMQKLMISNWGINAISTAADYNGQESIVIYRTLNTIDDGEDDNQLLENIHEILESKSIKTWIQTQTASRLQIKNYEYTKENLRKCWGILALFALLYAAVGTGLLSLVDLDRRGG